MAFESELDQAHGREDFEVLRTALEAYFHGFKSGNEPTDELQSIIDQASTNPSVGVPFAALASGVYDDPSFLAFVAAGPLEDLLRKPDKHTATRLADEARKFSRFRWMLSGVWLHAIHPNNRAIIAAAVGNVSLDREPMPQGKGRS